MALNEQVLGAAIKAAVQGVNDPQDNQAEVYEQMAKAIIDHFKAAGVITTVIPGGSSSGTHLGKIS
jgi:hypothetical protein